MCSYNALVTKVFPFSLDFHVRGTAKLEVDNWILMHVSGSGLGEQPFGSLHKYIFLFSHLVCLYHL